LDIPDVHAVQAGTFGRLFATHGMRAGRGRKVLEAKMRIEGQQAVGNFRIQPGNIAGYSADLLLVYVSWNQQSTGDVLNALKLSRFFRFVTSELF
jgi:hypothetical protein